MGADDDPVHRLVVQSRIPRLRRGRQGPRAPWSLPEERVQEFAGPSRLPRGGGGGPRGNPGPPPPRQPREEIPPPPAAAKAARIAPRPPRRVRVHLRRARGRAAHPGPRRFVRPLRSGPVLPIDAPRARRGRRGRAVVGEERERCARRVRGGEGPVRLDGLGGEPREPRRPDRELGPLRDAGRFRPGSRPGRGGGGGGRRPPQAGEEEFLLGIVRPVHVVVVLLAGVVVRLRIVDRDDGIGFDGRGGGDRRLLLLRRRHLASRPAEGELGLVRGLERRVGAGPEEEETREDVHRHEREQRVEHGHIEILGISLVVAAERMGEEE